MGGGSDDSEPLTSPVFGIDAKTKKKVNHALSGDSRVERPAPKRTRKGPGVAGSAPREKPKPARLRMSEGATAGDGRLERPAPKRDERPAAAGSGVRKRRMIQTPAGMRVARMKAKNG